MTAKSAKSALLKVILLGDGGVGKSSLMNRYVTNKFDSHLFHTIGVEFLNKELEVDGHLVTLQIWDTAGQERFRTITTSYFRGAQGILLVYDVTDRGSFNSIRNWVSQIHQHADVHVNKILVGNKCDMEGDRQVKTEEGQALADEFDPPMKFFETSAKQNQNVDGCFTSIATEVKNRLMTEGSGAPAPRPINLNHGGGAKKKGCC